MKAVNRQGTSAPLQTDHAIVAKNPFDEPGAPTDVTPVDWDKDHVDLEWKVTAHLLEVLPYRTVDFRLRKMTVEHQSTITLLKRRINMVTGYHAPLLTVKLPKAQLATSSLVKPTSSA